MAELTPDNKNLLASDRTPSNGVISAGTGRESISPLHGDQNSIDNDLKGNGKTSVFLSSGSGADLENPDQVPCIVLRKS